MRAEFAHWNALFKEYLKRDWKLILIWGVGLGGFAGGHLAVLSAGRVTRAGLYWRTVLIAVLSGTAGILAAAAGLGGSALAVMDECSLDLPGWFEKTAVLSWIPRMPMDEFDAVPFAVITLISIACMLIGYAGYRRRDLQERA